MKNLNENAEKILLEEQPALDLFNQIVRDDKWIRCYTNEIKAVPIENIPILIADFREKNRVGDEVTDESIQECMVALNLGVNVPTESGYRAYPIGDTALGSMVRRAGYNDAPVLMQLQPKESRRRMAAEDKAKILNLGYEVHKNKSLILIRDEKVRAVLSGDEQDYQVMPVNALVQTMRDQLGSIFPSVTFSIAFASHEFFGVTYQLDGPELRNSIHSFAGILSRAGLDPNALHGAARLLTSDVGLSGANLYPYLEGAGRAIMLGAPLTLSHKGANSLNDFRANVSKLLAMFKDAEAKICSMDNIPVKNIGGMLRRLAKAAGLPKKLSCEAAEQLEEQRAGNCYQTDVFFTLYDILEDYDADNGGLPVSRRIPLEEGISRVAFGNMSEADLPFQWE